MITSPENVTFAIILVRRLVITLTKAFLKVSRSVIGLVFAKLQFHAVGLGIGYITPSRHSPGISFKIKHKLHNFRVAVLISGPICFKNSFETFETPLAFPLGRELIVFIHSTSSIGAMTESYQCLST